ncbi:MAG: aminotransferase class I/II-fold pyridoxal phosphate-dependent enzyme [Candidatus Methanomethyliaceae archaeon]|nr:aminotransferase class I/II-fold pyridoxal phosphate-dependent enzyme [Candidatus Methanomethyliaceae archaeon]
MSRDIFEAIPPSPVSLLEMVEKIEKEKGTRVVRFDVAEPMFAPPWNAVKGTMDALLKGKHRYSSSWGVPELRQAITEYLKETRGLEYSPEEILVTTGGKFANFAFFLGLFKPGDAVVLVKPYWTSFKAVPMMLGLKVLETWAKDPYHLNEEELKDLMKARPRGIVVNTPNNPTGGLLDEADIKLLRDLAEDYDLYILSDEIDWAYVYDGRRFISPASLSGLRDRTIVTDGFSKIFGMTGWRVGFAAGPSALLKRLHTVQEHTVSAPTTFAQYGCLSALEGYMDHIEMVIRTCAAKRRLVVDGLKSAKGLDCPVPEGGFYVYPLIKTQRFSNTEFFAKELLEKAGVAVLPGEYFGDSRGHFRLCYAIPDEDLKEGIRRIVKFFE